LNVIAPTGGSVPARVSKPKGGRWKERVKVVKSSKRKLQKSVQGITSSHAQSTIPASTTPTTARPHPGFNDQTTGESALSKDTKMMHGKSQVRSSIFSLDTELIPKVCGALEVLYLLQGFHPRYPWNNIPSFGQHVGENDSTTGWQTQQRPIEHFDIHWNWRG
jgi:hypothetical protein